MSGNSPAIASLHGWIVVDKPRGLGSTQAVAAVKRLLREAGHGKAKVGHGGTLDPLAEGVLPIAVGEATKLAGRMLDSDKIYEFTIGFGSQTDTLDMEGTVVATSDHLPSHGDVDRVLGRFTGAIEQAPPAYSAIKVDGQRAYDRARAGEEVEMALRAVTIHALTVAGCEMAGEGEGLQSATLVAHVSKGTYIRSLARDIALALGSVGHVTYLRRIKAGPFMQDQAIALDKLADSARGRTIEQFMLPLTAGLDDIPALSVTPDEAVALRQGRTLIGKSREGLMLAMAGEVPVALVEAIGPEIRVVRGFNLS